MSQKLEPKWLEPKWLSQNDHSVVVALRRAQWDEEENDATPSRTLPFSTNENHQPLPTRNGSHFGLKSTPLTLPISDTPQTSDSTQNGKPSTWPRAAGQQRHTRRPGALIWAHQSRLPRVSATTTEGQASIGRLTGTPYHLQITTSETATTKTPGSCLQMTGGRQPAGPSLVSTTHLRDSAAFRRTKNNSPTGEVGTPGVYNIDGSRPQT